MQQLQSMTARERVALVVSSIVVGVSIVYWIVQIFGVIHMLRLAYG